MQRLSHLASRSVVALVGMAALTMSAAARAQTTPSTDHMAASPMAASPMAASPMAASPMAAAPTAGTMTSDHMAAAMPMKHTKKKDKMTDAGTPMASDGAAMKADPATPPK